VARDPKVFPALVVVLVVRAVAPFVLIRFGTVRTDRIGHHVGNIEVYLCTRETETSGHPVDLWYHPSDVSNQQIKRMWDRVLPTSQLVGYLDRVSRLVPGGEKHRIETTLVDHANLLSRCALHLVFTAEEERRGAAEVERLLGQASAQWVCLHSRDSAYLAVLDPLYDWAYHDYRDSNVQSFLEAACYVASRGYYAVRMGAIISRPLVIEGPRIVDYAAKGRSDFLDVYLEAHCRFHVGDCSGLNEIPRAFRRPVVYTNTIPLDLEQMCSSAPGSLFVPKKLHSRGQQRFLSFAEQIGLAAEEDVYFSQTYERLGIDVLENSPEDILGAVREMEERLEGSWRDTPEDTELQARFWRLFGSGRAPISGLRMGADFLRRNRNLL
jgi:putative glycosyltransferase (TIGR04372 family)